MSNHEVTESWQFLNTGCAWCLKISRSTIEVIFLFDPLRHISYRRSFTVITPGGAVWFWTIVKVMLIRNCIRTRNQFPLTRFMGVCDTKLQEQKILLKSKCSGILWNKNRRKFKGLSVLPNLKEFHVVADIYLLNGSASKRHYRFPVYGCRTQDTDTQQRWQYGLIVYFRLGLTHVKWEWLLRSRFVSEV